MNKCRHCNGTGRVEPGPDHNRADTNCLYCEGTGVAGVGSGLKPQSQEEMWKERARKLENEVRELRRAGAVTTQMEIHDLKKEISLLQDYTKTANDTILSLQQELATDETILHWLLDDVMSSLDDKTRLKIENRTQELRPILLQARSRKSDIISKMRNDLIAIAEESLDRDCVKMVNRLETYFAYHHHAI
jgi:methionine synthase II (cobalamin-independent)